MMREALDVGYVAPGRFVYGLVRDLSIAGLLVKCTARFGLKARNFDHAEAILSSAHELKPFLAVLDFENLENEAYKTLKEMCGNADFKDVPLIGFVTQSRSVVKEEAEKAGCDRVYFKTELVRELPDLIMRYAK